MKTESSSERARPAVRIRRARLADIEELLRLRLAVQEEFAYDGATPRQITDREGFLELSRDYFERKLPTEEFVVFVAEAEGRIVATSGMVVYEAPPTAWSPSGVDGYIINMYTLPERRGQGIAGALVDRLVEHAKSLKARRVWLRTSAMGRSVYAKAGFAEDDDYMMLRLESGK